MQDSFTVNLSESTAVQRLDRGIAPLPEVPARPFILMEGNLAEEKRVINFFALGKLAESKGTSLFQVLLSSDEGTSLRSNGH